VAARSLALRIELDGLEHLDRQEAYVVTPLHEGFADALALLRLPLDLRFIVRHDLLVWRWLGPYLRDTGLPRAGLARLPTVAPGRAVGV